MNTRFYYQDPYQTEFDATVVAQHEIEGHPAIVLDQTAFYPTSGGQPNDTGRLNDVRVHDVQVTDEGTVIHILEKPLTQTTVHGQVDWERRFDHMQQHTGQHILSQAFIQLFDIETVSFHMSEAISTIDLNRAPLTPQQVTQAVTLANKVVIENRPVTAQFVDQDRLSEFPLRKMPTVEGPIRIVQVAGFDWSPCGGTHVQASGEVGPIQVTRIERRKNQTRIHFLCGQRALQDYTTKQQIVQDLTAHFTTAEDQIMASVERMEAQVKTLQKKLSAIQAQLVEYELENWIANAQTVGTARVVHMVFDDYGLPMVKEIARRVTERKGMVALLATGQPRVQFVFARSDDVQADMSHLVRIACAAGGGRGGGRPQFAQGSIPDSSQAAHALNQAIQHLESERQ